MNRQPLPVLFQPQAVKLGKLTDRGIKSRTVPNRPMLANVILADKMRSPLLASHAAESLPAPTGSAEEEGMTAEAFVASLDDPEARGGPIPLPDGSFAERLPGMVKGDVSPALRSPASIIAHVEPLPLVPATWMVENARCGRASAVTRS